MPRYQGEKTGAEGSLIEEEPSCSGRRSRVCHVRLHNYYDPGEIKKFPQPDNIPAIAGNDNNNGVFPITE